MKLHLTLVLLLLSNLVSICFAQDNSEFDGTSISQIEYDALRSLDDKKSIYNPVKIMNAIEVLTKKVEQDLFPNKSAYFKIEIDFYTDYLQGGHRFVLKAEDFKQGVRIDFIQFMPAKAQMLKDNLKQQIENWAKDANNGFPITLCGYKGASAWDKSAIKYSDYNKDFDVWIGTVSGNPDIEAWGNKVCKSFEKHGLHNLKEYLLNLPVYEKQEEVIPEPIQDNIEDSISINIELKDSDNQFTLADEAILDVVIKNQSDEQLENLQFEIEVIKDKVTSRKEDFRQAFIDRYENILFWEPAISLKTINEDNKHLGFPSIKSNAPFTLSSGGQIKYSLIIKSAPEDNAWIYKHLINVKNSPLISELIRVKVKNTKGEILYDKQTPVLSNNEEVKIAYPNFINPSTIIPDKNHLKYYLKGDPNFTALNVAFLKLLACRAARYNPDDYKSNNGQWIKVVRHPVYLTIPEEEHIVIENMARYVHDVFSPKNWPEYIWRPDQHAVNIIEGKYGLGKPFSDSNSGFKYSSILSIESNKAGIACIEHAYFFNNLTRLFGFPTREITTLNFSVPIWHDINGGAQDASSEVFYLNPLTGKYEWVFYSLFNYNGKPIKDPFKRYGSKFGTFYMWRGVSPSGEFNSGPKKNRFTMKTKELNNSKYWEFHAIGYSNSIIDYNVKFEDAWKPQPAIKIEAHSPLTMYIELPDGQIIGSKEKISVSNELKQEFVFNKLSDSYQNLFSPFEGGAYLPEGLPIVTFTPPYIEETIQQIILPEKYLKNLKDINLQLHGTEHANFDHYILKLTTINNGIETTYDDQWGVISENEVIELKLSSFKSNLTFGKKIANFISTISLDNNFLKANMLFILIPFGILMLIIGFLFGKRRKKKKSANDMKT